MKRITMLGLATLAFILIQPESARADVYVRVPFVRVQVGGGVHVRAPFVNLYVPSGPRMYFVPGIEAAPSAYAPLQAEAIPTLPKKTPANAPPQTEAIPTPSKKTPANVPPQTETVPAPPKKTPAPPLPRGETTPDAAPPAPALGGLERILTPEQFTKSFQPKAGSYEVTLLNPVSNQATTVRFSLPEGTPRRVHVSANQIEFDYGPRQYVRIRFDREGAEVISR